AIEKNVGHARRHRSRIGASDDPVDGLRLEREGALPVPEESPGSLMRVLALPVVPLRAPAARSPACLLARRSATGLPATRFQAGLTRFAPLPTEVVGVLRESLRVIERRLGPSGLLEHLTGLFLQDARRLGERGDEAHPRRRNPCAEDAGGEDRRAE